MKDTRKLLCGLLLSAFLLLFFLPTHGQAEELRILYMNDFHGFAAPQKLLGSDETQGGIAYVAALIDRLRKEKPTLLLAAGDMIQGDAWANIFQGKPVIEIMNTMRFDAMVVGNHEFDFGQEALKQRILEAGFPVLGANVSGFSALRPYVLKEIAGLKVAIIGLVTQDTPTATRWGNVEGLTFLSVADTSERYVAELRNKVDIIVVLSHIGYNADMVLASIDLIVGGHSHTKVDKQILIGDTLLVQAWEHALVLGVLDLQIKDGKIIEAKNRLEEIRPASMVKDPSVAAIVEKYSTQVNGALNKVIGHTEIDLDGDNVRVRETNLGDLIADIMRKESSADVAIINGGAIRTSIRRGAIKAGDIYSTVPFDNYIVAMKVSGKQIHDALEHGVSAVESKDGRFPQVSGISLTYSTSENPGARIRAITVNTDPLDDGKTYTVATTDFLAAGGDAYQVFRDAIRDSGGFSVTGGTIKSPGIVYNDAGRWLNEVVVQYIMGQKKIGPKTEGRIRQVDCNENICK
ncbi:MAG TPA: 5'-nucleotidase C-terminal domain-containing protein [Syntrophorhabdaceae bacterium]|nr:5'-nucleotidase C-terminal domain-containing protein [Syntrophorhabdaceae bacterium]